jgi:hypothetical protein
MQYIANHLTPEQKRYRKEVILEQERHEFQKILDENGINLHVKKIDPHYIKSQKLRIVSVEFDEKIAWAAKFGLDDKIVKRKINKYIELYEVYIPYNVNDFTNPETGIESNRPICVAGTRYPILDENKQIVTFEDNEILRVKPLLYNRYWLWIHGVDKMLWNVCDLIQESKEYANKYYDQLDMMWLAEATWENRITTPLEEMIELFNKQVESGVICDSEYGTIDHYIGEHKMWHTIENTSAEIFNKRIMK